MKAHLKLSNNTDIYWTTKKCDSYNCFLNIIVGGRGIGKTTSCLIKGITRYVNFGEQFIYLRRYKGELKEFIDKKKLNKICDNIRYLGDGNDGWKFLIDNEEIGYGCLLSKADTYKGADFEKVSTIIFDEGVIEKGNNIRYLSNEVNALLNFISTIQRTRTNLKVYILGNNLDLFCPLIRYWNIPVGKKLYVDTERSIYYCEEKASDKLRELESKTPLFKLTSGTSFGDYHYENKLISNTKADIGDKPETASLIMRLVIENNTLNMYSVYYDGIMWLYFERKERKIIDKYSKVITENGSYNYYYIDDLKRNFLKMWWYFWYHNKCKFNCDLAHSMADSVLELLA